MVIQSVLPVSDHACRPRESDTVVDGLLLLIDQSLKHISDALAV